MTVAPVDLPPLSVKDKLEAIQEGYYLKGEDVYRKGRWKAGQPWRVRPTCNSGETTLVVVTAAKRRPFTIHLHRMKFALHHGWLPEQVIRLGGSDRLDDLVAVDVPPGGHSARQNKGGSS